MALVTTMLASVSGGSENFTSITTTSITVTGLTASRAVVTDGSKNLASSAVTATELGYLSGVTTPTGSGALVLATSPTLVTPTLGAATATTITCGFGSQATPAFHFSTDTDTGIWRSGSNTITMVTNAYRCVEFKSSPTNTVNYMTFRGAATTDPVLMAPEGSDTDISVYMTPKGAGTFNIRGATNAGTLTLWNAGNTFATHIKAANVAQTDTYTLPTGLPSATGYLFSSTTAGVTSWVNPASTGGWVLLNTATASASAAIAFTGLTSAYIAYKVVITGLAVATDEQALWMRTSTDNGSNYDAGASDYAWGTVATQFTATPTPTGAGDDADAQIVIAQSLGNAANELANFEVTIFNPSAAAYCHVEFSGNYTNGSTALFSVTGGGARLAAADVDAIQFLAASGNLATGEFRLFGLKGA